MNGVDGRGAAFIAIILIVRLHRKRLNSMKKDFISRKREQKLVIKKGRKLGQRRYASAEKAFLMKELFENQARVTINDICNKLKC
jgi:hypothetical protein